MPLLSFVLSLADITVKFTLNNLALFLILGGVIGLGTGYLMKSKGVTILGDVVFGLIGALIGAYVLTPALDIGRGLLGQSLASVFGCVLAVAILHFVVVVRQKARA